jgi:hypothetical protein
LYASATRLYAESVIVLTVHPVPPHFCIIVADGFVYGDAICFILSPCLFSFISAWLIHWTQNRSYPDP